MASPLSEIPRSNDLVTLRHRVMTPNEMRKQSIKSCVSEIVIVIVQIEWRPRMLGAEFECELHKWEDRRSRSL